MSTLTNHGNGSPTRPSKVKRAKARAASRALHAQIVHTLRVSAWRADVDDCPDCQPEAYLFQWDGICDAHKAEGDDLGM